MKPIQIALTFDTDSDFFDSSLLVDAKSARPEWKGVEIGTPRIFDFCNSLKDSEKKSAKMTWFVRSDDQVQYYYDDPAYVFKYYSTYWTELKKIGGELAWHPHLYAQQAGKWVLDQNPETLSKQMKAGLRAAQEFDPHITSSRIGEAFGSNAVFSTLDELGITKDSSALPGRKRQDQDRILDWMPTPKNPYHPSLQDYRIPGLEQRKVLEVPFSMVQVKASYDEKPFYRYLDLSFRNEILAPALPELIAQTNLIVAIAHPTSLVNELAPDKAHGLLSFSFEHFKKNTLSLLEECRRQNKPYRFVRVCDVQ